MNANAQGALLIPGAVVENHWFTYKFSFPVFSLQDRATLCPVVIVDVEWIGEGTEQTTLTLHELHVPTSPDHIVQPIGQANLIQGLR